jgi:signal transduction histidine kinase
MNVIRRVFAAPFSSVRTRLTLWNVGVLALVLVALSIVLRVTLEENRIAEGDQIMTGIDHNAKSRWEDGYRPGRWVRDAGRPFGPHNPATSTGDRGPFNIAHRPRIITPDGKNLYSNEPEQAFDAAAFRRAVADAPAGFTDLDILDQPDPGPYRVYTDSWRTGNRVTAVFQVEMPLKPIYDEVDRLTRALLALSPFALLIAGAGGAFLTDRALHPVRAVTRAAARTQAADLSARLAVTGNDELSELAATFNAMLARLEEAFTRQERAFEQQRRFVADASHELKTPLTVIKANTSLALACDDLSNEEYRDALVAVDSATDRTVRIVRDLFLLARSDNGRLPLERNTVSLAVVMTNVAREARLVHPDGATIQVTPGVETLPTLTADPHLLHQIFVNLVENAQRYTPAGGTVTLSAVQNDGYVVATVADSGSGIAPDQLPHVMERFFRADAARARTNGAGAGTGLGLAICHAIVEAHGGTIAIDSVLGSGTTVTVRLPIA